jgi:molybdopterin molybdotransferase
MLIALARRAGAHVSDGGCCDDDMQALSREIARASGHNDLVLISGGSSVGDADLTSAALRHAGAQVEELKIAMKPGKPALIATLGQAIILGLPGNPVAAYASWFTLGRSVLARMFGLRQGLLQGHELTVTNELHRRPGRAELVPARQVRTILGIHLEFFGPAGSARLSPLSSADGFALVESNRDVVAAGEIVTFLPFEDGEVL